MNIVYFGSGEFGLPTLASLDASHTVVAVVTQPDRPAGRGRELTPTPVGAWAAENLRSARLLKPERVNVPEVVASLRGLDAGVWVVIAFGQKLGRPLLEGRFAINLHASLLPRWRGAAPISAAMLAGDAETGNTVITLADRMDAGEILGASRRPIDPMVTAGELHDLLAADGPALVGSVLGDYDAGRLAGRRQDESLATSASKLSRADGWIDFGEQAAVCRRRVHGLTPWPGVAARLGEAELKLRRVREADVACPPGARAGQILDAGAGHVACGGGTVLELLEVQPAGKRQMAWREFARGHAIDEAARLEGTRAR